MTPKERIEASCFEYDLKNFLLKFTFFIKVLDQDPDPESMNLVPQHERSFLFVHHPSFTTNFTIYMYNTQSTYVYLEYHSVCPLVGIGTPPPPPQEGGGQSPAG